MDIEEIKEVTTSQKDGWYSKFEDIISLYYEEKGFLSIPDLASLFSDSMPTELNFSIIHLIEQSEINSYVGNYLKIFKNEVPNDHNWLDLLLIRMMNDNRYFVEVLSKVPNLIEVEKSNFRKMVSQMIVDHNNADFIDRLEALQQAAS